MSRRTHEPIEVESHREWKYLYDFAKGEEIVEVRRPDGRTDTYSGPQAAIFKLRSEGLNLKQATEVVLRKAIAQADVGMQDQWEASGAEHLLEHVEECHDSCDDLLSTFASLVSCLNEAISFDPVTPEEFRSHIEEQTAAFVAHLSESVGADISPFHALTGFGLSLFMKGMGQLEIELRDQEPDDG